jgi:hypothetical protein
MIPNYKYYIDKGLVKMISECTTIRSLHKEDTKAGIFNLMMACWAHVLEGVLAAQHWVSFIVEITPSFEPKGFQAIKITTSVKKGQDSCLTKSSKIVHAVEAHHLLVSQLWPSIIWRKDIPWRDDTGIPPHLKCIKHRNNFEGPSFFSFQHWSIVFNLSLRSQKKGIVPSLHWYYFMFHLRLNITLEQL